MSQAHETTFTSVYANDAGIAEKYASLTGDVDVDIAVVGAGFTGLSTALHLAEMGTSVAVLDAFQPGWGASGRNGGQINPGLKFDPDQIEQMFPGSQGTTLVDFAWNSPSKTLSLIRRLGIECDWRQNGTMRAAIHEKPAAAIRRTYEQCAARGMPVDVLDGDVVSDLTGTTRYHSAMIDHRGGDLNPLKYVRGLATAAQKAGAVVYGDSHILSIDRKSAHWIVKTATGSVRARRVLLATNGYTDGLWPKLRRTVVPVFSAIAATEPLPADIARKILKDRQVLYESGNITVYYRVDADNRLLMGGRGPMRPIESSDQLPNLTKYASRLWPELSSIRWTNAWNGRVAMTEDHLPHIHELDGGLIACLGYNGRGVALSTALGASLAKFLIEGKTEVLPLPFTAAKPIAFHGLWPIGAKAVILKGRIKDALGR